MLDCVERILVFFFAKKVSRAVRSKTINDKIFPALYESLLISFEYCSLRSQTFTHMLKFSDLGGQVYHQFPIKYFF